jgi:hypothetical protein
LEDLGVGGDKVNKIEIVSKIVVGLIWLRIGNIGGLRKMLGISRLAKQLLASVLDVLF